MHVLVNLELLPSLQATFEHLSTSDLRNSHLPVEHLLSSLEKFEFVINRHALAETSGLLIDISRSLQTVGSDIIKALDEVKGAADILAIMHPNSAVKMAET